MLVYEALLLVYEFLSWHTWTYAGVHCASAAGGRWDRSWKGQVLKYLLALLVLKYCSTRLAQVQQAVEEIDREKDKVHAILLLCLLALLVWKYKYWHLRSAARRSSPSRSWSLRTSDCLHVSLSLSSSLALARARALSLSRSSPSHSWSSLRTSACKHVSCPSTFVLVSSPSTFVLVSSPSTFVLVSSPSTFVLREWS